MNRLPALICLDEDMVKRSDFHRFGIEVMPVGDEKTVSDEIFGYGGFTSKPVNNPRLRGLKLLVDANEFLPCSHTMYDKRLLHLF